jgi:ankyrin repeat protein
MRYRKVVVAGAVVAAIGLSTPFWLSTQAQENTMSGFKRYPPEQFFSGQQLELAKAIRDGDLDRVKGLASNVNLNAPGNSNMTLLAFSIQEAVPVKSDGNNVRFQIISQLVKYGAKPEQTFLENSNIAFAAARADTPNFLKALLAGGMSPDLRYDGDTPLLFATAKDRQLPEMKLLIEHKADVNIRDSIGDTALTNATQLRQWDTVDYLLAHGANPTVANSNGVTYSKVLAIELQSTPKDSPQLARIDAIAKRIVAAGGKWPPA